MNRPDYIQSLAAGALASGGIDSTVEVVTGDQRPLFVVIRSKRYLNCEQTEALRKDWDHFRKLNPEIPPACVVGPDIEIDVVRELGDPPQLGDEYHLSDDRE